MADVCKGDGSTQRGKTGRRATYHDTVSYYYFYGKFISGKQNEAAMSYL